jgi:hypothetical protein
VLSEDLRAACLAALQLSRNACRQFALRHSWETSAQQFIGHLNRIAGARAYASRATWTVQPAANR